MSEEITASANLDVATHLPAFKWTHKGVRARGFALIGIAALCVLFVIGLGIGKDKIDNQTLAIFTLVTVFSLISGFRFFRAKSFFVQQIKGIPGYGEKQSWLFKDDGYEARIGESQSHVSWNHVTETKATPDGVLIYPQPTLWEWLPKTAFTSEADYNRFLDLLATKTKHSKLS